MLNPVDAARILIARYGKDAVIRMARAFLRDNRQDANGRAAWQAVLAAAS